MQLITSPSQLSGTFGKLLSECDNVLLATAWGSVRFRVIRRSAV